MDSIEEGDTFIISTRDNYDHLFHGIMFDIESNFEQDIPVEILQLESISIKGTLGNVTVWVSNGSHEQKFDDRQQWVQVYHNNIVSNGRRLVPLILDEPIDLPPPGERKAVYIHTSSQDRMLYYGDERSPVTFENSFVKIYSGLGHLNPMPFDVTGNWWPWRPHREFAGEMSFKIKLHIWSPLRNKFPYLGRSFLNSVYTFLLCMQRISGKKVPPFGRDVVYVIMEMLHWTDFLDENDLKFDNEIVNRSEQDAIGWHQGHYMTHVTFHRQDYQRRVNGGQALNLNDQFFFDM